MAEPLRFIRVDEKATPPREEALGDETAIELGLKDPPPTPAQEAKAATDEARANFIAQLMRANSLNQSADAMTAMPMEEAAARLAYTDPYVALIAGATNPPPLRFDVVVPSEGAQPLDMWRGCDDLRRSLGTRCWNLGEKRCEQLRNPIRPGDTLTIVLNFRIDMDAGSRDLAIRIELRGVRLPET